MNEESKQEITKPRRKFLKRSLALVVAIAAGGLYWPNRWKYIVIHHSAGNYGNIEFLQKIHRQRQSKDPIDAIPYHYVIGNGNGLKMGEVANDWRKENNIWGAHVSGRNSDRNFRGLGICLIGNFEENEVPEAQYQSLVKLTKQLMAKHNILAENLSGHGLTPGETTLCPGKHFPMERFIRDVININA